MPEQYIGGLESAYLWRGRLRLNAYGIYATNDKLIGMKVRARILVAALLASIILATLATFFSVRSLLIHLSSSSSSPFDQFLGQMALPLVFLSLTPIFLSAYFTEKMTRKPGVRTIEDGRKRDFEAQKSEIAQIEVKRGRDLRSGHLLILLKSGESIKVKIGGFTGRSPGILVQVMELVDAFWGKGPDLRSFNCEVWRSRETGPTSLGNH